MLIWWELRRFRVSDPEPAVCANIMARKRIYICGIDGVSKDMMILSASKFGLHYYCLHRRALPRTTWSGGPPLFVLRVAILHLWTSPGEIYQHTHTHFSLCPCASVYVCFHVRADRVLLCCMKGSFHNTNTEEVDVFQCVRFIYVMRFPS